jgi:hypothetical protein
MRESHIYYIGLSYKIFFNVQRDELASPSPSLNSPIKAEQQQQQQHYNLTLSNSQLFSKPSSPSPRTIAKMIENEDTNNNNCSHKNVI